MTCPFSMTPLREGATVCHECGATLVQQRREGLVAFVAVVLPVAIVFGRCYAQPNVSWPPKDGGSPDGVDLAVFVICLVLALLIPKRRVWIRNVG